MTSFTLPTIDGTRFFGFPCQALIFDNSSLEDWQTCSRLYQYKDLERRCKASESAGRNFGSACHRAWEYRYKVIGTEPVTPEGEAGMFVEMQKHFEANPQPEGDFRDLAHAQRYIQAYNKHYPKEPFSIVLTPKGVPCVEQSFALPLGEAGGYKLVYAGKVDMAIRLDDDLWTFDNKTAFQFGSGFQREMEQNGGQAGYLWSVQQVLGETPQGYFINACRVRRPPVSGIAPVDASDFLRLPYHVTQAQIDDWKQDTLALVEEIIWAANRGYMPRHRKACVGKYGTCDFYDVCSVMPHARSEILASNLYKENKWTPLKRPE